MSDLEIIRNVLKMESKAIDTLACNLSEEHMRLVEICDNCKGKIIFTGIGKSGHVARKISSTIASLGTPSFYLHPGEAVHGDLGMVEKNDILIMISKSGETDELRQLIPSIKLIGTVLIGIFCKSNSSLEKNCDYTIVLPLEREACINNLAPTTSTTLTMAFGDALAVALSERRNFGKQDFAIFHPKGNLGKQLLLTVDDISNKDENEIKVNESDDVKTVLMHITKNRLGAVSVTDSLGRLVGLISDGDIRRAIEKDACFFDNRSLDIMTRKPIYTLKGTLAIDAFRIMKEKKVSVLPIVDNEGVLVGMVSLHDIISVGIGD